MSKDEEELDPRETPEHPRHQYGLIGQGVAETKLLESYKSGRFHHAWLMCGPQGIGKATLAYRLARFILNHRDHLSSDVQNAVDLTVESDNGVAHRVAARAHSDLFVLQRELNRKTKKLRPAIAVDDARRLGGFFNMTAGEGGWRICIIDAADDLNASAANAILKILEEPPKNCLFLIISHAPGRLLPTIRSRCLRLDLAPLKGEEVAQVVSSGLQGHDLSADETAALIALGSGSPGKVMQLVTSQGARQFIRFQQAVSAPQGFSLSIRMTIAEEFQKRGAEIEFGIFADLLESWIGRQARQAAEQSDHAKANALALCHSAFSDSIARTNALNLDRRQTLMMAFADIEKILNQ
ncbi:DNA polymerase III delta prime subunit [hydrothermal vent metagenome]|uniref:DNA polymerase III delta prime subunit n=1 Tax=hydrothermal vent metagenome TaxID=652676 RepID=A0A3B0RVH4_9ZZZZ